MDYWRYICPKCEYEITENISVDVVNDTMIGEEHKCAHCDTTLIINSDLTVSIKE